MMDIITWCVPDMVILAQPFLSTVTYRTEDLRPFRRLFRPPKILGIGLYRLVSYGLTGNCSAMDRSAMDRFKGWFVG
jgi:hypothetical protein